MMDKTCVYILTCTCILPFSLTFRNLTVFSIHYDKHHNRPILIVVETIVKDAAAAVEVAVDMVKVAVKVAVKAVVDAVKAVAADVDAVKAVVVDVVAMVVVADEVVAVVVQARRLASTSKIQTPFRHCRYGDMTGI
jgi:hypothetical protein